MKGTSAKTTCETGPRSVQRASSGAGRSGSRPGGGAVGIARDGSLAPLWTGPDGSGWAESPADRRRGNQVTSAGAGTRPPCREANGHPRSVS
jgi:hypothetical protein